MSTEAHPRRVGATHVVPWTPGERTRLLLDAITRVHAAGSPAQVVSVAVEAMERALPGAAAALFTCGPPSPVVSLRAAGHRWRSAERDSPAWLAGLTGAIAGLVRSQAPVSGALVRSSSTHAVHEGGVHVAQVPVIVDGWPWGSLVALWPGGDHTCDGELWMVEEFVAQLGLALEHATAAEELRRALASSKGSQEDAMRSEQLRVAGELAAGLAHDFNNTLTTVLGVTEWLLHSRAFDDDVRADLEAVRSAAADAAVTVKRLRMIGRRATTDEREAVPVDELAAMSIEMIRPRLAELLERRHVRIDVELRDAARPLVLVSAMEIREVLLNLLLNAVDAMPSGGRVIVETAEAGGTVSIAVTDDGEGMTEDVLARAFEPFFSTKARHGRGLGLSVCRDIAKTHGGRLTVESTAGQGSTFCLLLPVVHEAGSVRG